jgi:hypothetical protein
VHGRAQRQQSEIMVWTTYCINWASPFFGNECWKPSEECDEIHSDNG